MSARDPLARRLAPNVVASATGERRVDETLAEFTPATRALVVDHAPVRRLLAGIADHSSFLWSLAQRDPERLERILSSDPDADFTLLLTETRETCVAAISEPSVRKTLRRARAHVALLVALADLGGVWPLGRVTEALSAAAETFVACALDFLLRDAARKGRLNADADPATGCGLIVLGLGKLGAGELNYSSDIDLVVFYEAGHAPLPEGAESGPIFVRITQALSRLISDRTEDGYVARVDLRLRPDPGSTPVAVSVPAALSYYETLGQNWERAAFIKARPIAGSAELGDAFLKELVPFVWRRYFDYAAIADIHAMKRQIHAVRGFAEVVVPGHDVKLGRGGIREIEFFVQTQQLIFGGRRPEMRGRQTLAMLDQLAADGWVTEDARIELSEAYVALRTVEHRLQMIADEQTQRLPSDPDTLERFARFCGFPTTKAFAAWITGHFRKVEKHYSRLFEHAPGLDASVGALVFTGTEDDPATIETLRALGYKQPSVITETIRGWHFGHRPAVRSARAREVLTDLVPALLQSFAKCGDPDGAVAAFDTALARMPAATELFSVLRSSAPLRVLFGDILGAAPRLTDIVTATPHVLDAVIDQRSFGIRYDEAAFATDVAGLSGLGSTEEFLDRCRLVARESQFVIGVRVLSRTIEPRDAGPAYTGLATALVDAALRHVSKVFAREHGVLEGMRIAILALGKLGSREMTAASDLDLMIVYQADDDAISDGRRPLAASLYAARLTQRLIAALTAPTREGRLYEIDLRLRPWGTQGPLAVRFDAFANYHAGEAETWERMSLCRARPIAGDPAFQGMIAAQIRTILTRPPAPTLASDIVDMRGRIAQAKGQSDRDDLKTFRGGLIDIEFVAQFLILRHAATHPSLIRTATCDVIAAAKDEKILPPDIAEDLLAAHRLYSDVVQMQRLALPADAPMSKASATVRRLIAMGAGFPDAAALDDAIGQRSAVVREVFRKIVGSAPT